MKKRVLCIVGTRPEVIKMAPVINCLKARGDKFQTIVCSTGQHRQMLDQVCHLFGLTPDIDLDVMLPDQSLAGLTARLLESLDRVVCEVEPDWILAQGDTTSVFVASLLSYYRKIKFGHVEAGLRTTDIFHPFPEEVNRRFSDLLSTVRFAPTDWAVNNLIAEGCPEKTIFLTGNTVVDALHEVLSMPFDWKDSPLCEIPREGRIVLVTAHRRESFGRPFQQICEALKTIASHFEEEGLQLVYPVHLNPQVRSLVYSELGAFKNIHLLEPLDYVSLVNLMRESTLVLTDSGGIQEEAPCVGVPVLVMRDVTERPEGVNAGVARLVGTDTTEIVRNAIDVLSDSEAYEKMKRPKLLYGDGRAAGRIVDVLEGFGL